jgi:hypothetical protein
MRHFAMYFALKRSPPDDHLHKLLKTQLPNGREQGFLAAPVHFEHVEVFLNNPSRSTFLGTIATVDLQNKLLTLKNADAAFFDFQIQLNTSIEVGKTDSHV